MRLSVKRRSRSWSDEDLVWARIGKADRVWAIADEDIERSREGKTEAVHFLRFQFTDEMVRDAKAGAAIGIGIEHAEYDYRVEPLGEKARDSLVADLV
jgi:hypothetical protein